MLSEVVAEGDRALVFTQYAQMGHLLAAHLPDVLGCEVLYLHGGVPRTKREELVAGVPGRAATSRWCSCSRSRRVASAST